ncbi:MAG: hypothetical protein FWH04_01495 [Oscillospiraceae bacterium]|nr:hypothetical protein [Oscillospiraceae bacterium]
MKKNKILWVILPCAVVSLLYLLPALLSYTTGYTHGWSLFSLFFLSFTLPIVICVILTILKKPKMLWIAGVPPLYSFVALAIEIPLSDFQYMWYDDFMMMFIWASICVALSLLFIYLIKSQIKMAYGLIITLALALSISLQFLSLMFELELDPVLQYGLAFCIQLAMCVVITISKKPKLLWIVMGPAIANFVVPYPEFDWIDFNFDFIFDDLKLPIALLALGAVCILSSLLHLYFSKKKINKILASVIIFLLMLELFITIIGFAMQPNMYGGGIEGIMAIILFITYLAVWSPVVLTVLIVLTKQYKVFWIALIPSAVQFVIVASDSTDMAFLFSDGYKFMVACACVALAYLCVFIGKKIKNKKGDDTSC